MRKLYNLLLDDYPIGTTELEKADAPMGVVFGDIIFFTPDVGYDFFKQYCLNNNITIATDYPDEKLILVGIPTLKVVNSNGVEIKGEATVVEGMDTDGFNVTVLGVPYPFFEDEFPHHVNAYNDQFKKQL